jgi:hypothetical protein
MLTDGEAVINDAAGEPGGNLSGPFWPQAARKVMNNKAAKMKVTRRMERDFERV